MKCSVSTACNYKYGLVEWATRLCSQDVLFSEAVQRAQQTHNRIPARNSVPGCKSISLWVGNVVKGSWGSEDRLNSRKYWLREKINLAVSKRSAPKHVLALALSIVLCVVFSMKNFTSIYIRWSLLFTLLLTQQHGNHELTLETFIADLPYDASVYFPAPPPPIYTVKLRKPIKCYNNTKLVYPVHSDKEWMYMMVFK